MRIEEFERLAKVADQPLLLVSATGAIVAANPAAARLSPALVAGSALHDAIADPIGLDEQLTRWLKLGGPVPAHLELRQDGQTQMFRARVGRVGGVEGPALLLSIQHSPSDHRFGQLTDQVRRLQQETRHRRAAEARQQAALAAEKAAREQLERLQELTSVLAVTPTVKQTAQALLDHGPSAVGADDAVVVLAERPDRFRVLGPAESCVGARPGRWGLEDLPLPLRAALEDGAARYFTSADEVRAADPSWGAGDGAQPGTRFLAGLLPLVASEEHAPIGLLGFVSATSGLSPEQQVMAQIVTAQGAQALERARLYDDQRRAAETLQRALLPEDFPHTEGVDCAVRYLPAAEAEAVGGDWYAVIDLGDGRVGLGVGDVAGHGPAAATAMGTMRSALRALATTSDSPAEVITALNRFVCSQLPDEMATCTYLIVDVHAGTLAYANAGHLPPLLMGPSQQPTYLEEVLSPPLGVTADVTYQGAVCTLPARSHVVLYTDGLIERRDEAIDVGLDRLQGAARGDDVSPTRLCDHLLTALVGTDSLDDDTALLVASISPDRDLPDEAASNGVDHCSAMPDSPKSLAGEHRDNKQRTRRDHPPPVARGRILRRRPSRRTMAFPPALTPHA